MRYLGRSALFTPVDINELADVDVSTVAPSIDDLLKFNGTNWVPLAQGSGGGLDADLLDGQEATAFATAAQGNLADSAVQPADDADVLGSGDAAAGTFLGSNGDGTADWQNLPNVESLSNAGVTAGFVLQADGDGSSSFVDPDTLAIDAGTLDGIDSAGFVQTSTDQTVAGNKTFSGTTTFNADVNIRTNLDLADNDILRFGSGDDAEFFCDGTHFYLDLNSGIGNFYIRDGTTTRFTFDDAGDFTATGNVTAYSDASLKKNVETISDALNKVTELRGVYFDRVDNDSHSIGVIAQEVEEVIPEVVLTHDDGLKSVSYGNLVGLLIEAIKELSIEVQELKNGINS